MNQSSIVSNNFTRISRKPVKLFILPLEIWIYTLLHTHFRRYSMLFYDFNDGCSTGPDFLSVFTIIIVQILFYSIDSQRHLFFWNCLLPILRIKAENIFSSVWLKNVIFWTRQLLKDQNSSNWSRKSRRLR